ncbi:M14 family metallopeptidase [Ferruginibacter sp. HRS2-29]|uniref:M14 family metallopeptidase n=1 Tax=Ferruginibacter sp. HRS2-29 TaxID=2487334 RepID=UPI0020CBF9EE|nr:M14 family metallopeptidase [Ferruginibacter sp. HRS2-29]MCP9750983.1 hypothetical protein [Ferruginibacter sp. HRS2-29]
MKQLLLFIPYTLLCFYSHAQQTVFEQSYGTQTATYQQAIQWYYHLAKQHREIKIAAWGSGDAGKPLHLVLLSADQKFDPKTWHRQKKAVILINNGIHPGEPDGIDASMMLVRDIVNKKITLPQNVTLAFIPVYNIGGCLNRNTYTRANQNGPAEYGFRGNSQNLDLNRDFTKTDSKEAATFARIFHYLDPEILIDNHVSDGADYQHTMTLISTQYDKLGPTLGGWLRNTFEPAIYKGMADKKWELIPYVDFEFTDFSKGMKMFYDPPRYSSGYAALFQTLSFMPETHMLKPYKERVQSTYDLMVTFIQQASLHATELLDARTKARNELKAQTIFPLKWKADTSTFRQVIFKGYERDSSLSEATGLMKMFYSHSKPYTREIKYFDHFTGMDSINAPTTFIIPQGWHEVIERLKNNGVEMSYVQQPATYEVSSYHIDSYKSMAFPYEKHHRNYNVKATVLPKKPVQFQPGDVIIRLDQPARRYLMEMLTPTGDDSFFAWNFFDAILQQKEGYSDYRWEDIAAQVLKNDSLLQQKLAEKKAADPAFAKDSEAILDFIYRNSPYYEKAHLQYPVYWIE